MKLSASDRDEKILLHCATLAKVVLAVRPAYVESAEAQRALIETMIGAAIWYTPKPLDAWTGMISEAALRSFHPASDVVRPRVSEEHVYPRKVAAKQLLEKANLNAEEMLRSFKTRYARVHYITPDENKMVTKYQRTSVFRSPDEAYQLAGIRLVSIDRNHIRAIKKRDRGIIENYLH